MSSESGNGRGRGRGQIRAVPAVPSVAPAAQPGVDINITMSSESGNGRGRGRGYIRAVLSVAPAAQPGVDIWRATSPLSQANPGPSTSGISFGYGRGGWLRPVAASARGVATTSTSSMFPMADDGRFEAAPEPVPLPNPNQNTNRRYSADVVTQQLSNISVHEMPAEPISTIVVTNSLKLAFDKKKIVHYYDVRFKPDLKCEELRPIMLEALPVRRATQCYDGGYILYLTEKLDSDMIKVPFLHPYSEESMEIIVTFKRSMRMSECDALLGILFRNCLKELNFEQVYRQYYDPEAERQLRGHTYALRLKKGFATTVSERNEGVFLTFEPCHRVLSLKSVYDEFLKNRRQGENLTNYFVLSSHDHRVHRVKAIDWDRSPLSQFEGDVSYQEFYKDQFNIEIKADHQPLLIINKNWKGDDMALIPELCYLTDHLYEMPGDLRQKIDNLNIMTPQKWDEGIRNLVRSLKENVNVVNTLAEWGLHIPDEATSLSARILDTPQLEFGKNLMVPANAAWGQEASLNPVFRGVDIQKWILLHEEEDESLARSFTDLMMKVAQTLDITIQEPSYLKVNMDHVESVMENLRAEDTPDLQLVVVLMGSHHDNTYEKIEEFCCIDRGVASHSVLSEKLEGNTCDETREILHNIAPKIIVKLGGALWRCHIPIKNLMICGIDVCHDPKTGRGGGALVASIDANHTKFVSFTSVQKPKVELMDTLGLGAMIALLAFREENGCFPERIIVFRKELSDPQIRIMLEHEVPQFERACQELKAKEIKFVFIVVNKGVAQRYYTPTGGNRLTNPAPGTVVDHSITKCGYRNFFLVSEKVQRGTASPTHYMIVRDDANMEIEDLQKLSYMLCHMCYDSPETVSVPAPCLYAHKLAKLMGRFLRRPDEKLHKRLHYL